MADRSSKAGCSGLSESPCADDSGYANGKVSFGERSPGFGSLEVHQRHLGKWGGIATGSSVETLV